MMDEDHTNWTDLDQDVDLLRKHAKKSLKKEGDYAEVARSRMLIYILFGL